MKKENGKWKEWIDIGRRSYFRWKIVNVYLFLLSLFRRAGWEREKHSGDSSVGPNRSPGPGLFMRPLFLNTFPISHVFKNGKCTFHTKSAFHTSENSFFIKYLKIYLGKYL